MKVDVFSCSADPHEAALRRSNFYYRGKGASQYVGPVVNGQLHLFSSDRHVMVSVQNPQSETSQNGNGTIPSAHVYGLLILDTDEHFPWPSTNDI